jgi:hypothetical protein
MNGPGISFFFQGCGLSSQCTGFLSGADITFAHRNALDLIAQHIN